MIEKLRELEYTDTVEPAETVKRSERIRLWPLVVDVIEAAQPFTYAAQNAHGTPGLLDQCHLGTTLKRLEKALER